MKLAANRYRLARPCCPALIKQLSEAAGPVQVGEFVTTRFLPALKLLPAKLFQWHLHIITASEVPMLTFRHRRNADRVVARALCNKADELGATGKFVS